MQRRGSPARVVAEVGVMLVAAAIALWAWRADAHWFERHFTEARCIRDAGEIRRVVLWRALGVVVAMLLAFVARPRVGRWIARARAGATARVGIAVILALVASELVLKVRADSRDAAMAAPMRDSADYGTEMTPSTVSTETIGARTITYATNAEGDRVIAPGDEPEYAAPTLLFTGESIVFGQGVEAKEAFPFVVGAALDLPVVDLAAIGYGGVQAYLRAKDALPRFAHPVALVSIFIPELLERNVNRYRRVRLRSDGTLERIAPEPLWTHFLHLRWTFRKAFPFNADDDEAVDVERAVLRETAAMARAHGAIPLFVVTHYAKPCVPVDGEAPWIVRSLFDDPTLPKVEVTLDPSWVVPGDKHPDARAHAKIAEAVAEALRGAHLADL